MSKKSKKKVNQIQVKGKIFDIEVAEKQVVDKNTSLNKVLLTLYVLTIITAIYLVAYKVMGWSNPEKVIKQKMASADKDAVEKKYESSIGKYENIIKRWGNNSKLGEEIRQAKLNMAKQYKNSERYLEAIYLYKKLAAEYQGVNNDMYAWLLLELGDCYNKILNAADAIDTYNKIINTFADTDWASEALFGIAETYKKQKKYDKTIEYYDKIIAKYKKTFLCAEALTNKGIILEEQGKIKQALSVYNTVVRDFPDIVTGDAKLRADKLSAQKK